MSAKTKADKLLLEEYARRKAAKGGSATLVDSILGELFAQQREVVLSPAREKGILAPRRSGKTAIHVRYARILTLQHERVLVRIWAINRTRAKQLIWDELKLLDARHGIECHYNESELSARLSNGSEIRLLGADKDKEAQKKRGDKTILEIVTEAQLFGPYLKTLVEDVAKPCLFDLQGTFVIEGTPGPVCQGYWWDVSGRENDASQWISPGGKEGVGSGWQMFRWSVLDNPFLPHAKQEIEREKKARRWDDDHPTYVREWLGRWVNDLGVLYYKYDPARNVYDGAAFKPYGPGWQHSLGWRLGYQDDMSLVAWGWNAKHAELYEAYSWTATGAKSTDIVAQVKKLEEDGFVFQHKIADVGVGGKVFVDEVASRHKLSFAAAKKADKYHHVRLFNDELVSGKVKLRAGSVLQEELSTLARDQFWPSPDQAGYLPPREDPRCSNRVCGAALFSFRGAYHYLFAEREVKQPPGVDARESRFLEQLQKKHSTPWWERDLDNFNYEEDDL